MNKLANSRRTLKVLETLRKYSSEEKRLTATDINRYLADEGFIKVDRKTIYEDLKIIEDTGFNLIKGNKTVFLDGNPFTYIEVKLLTDVVNSLSFLNSKDKQVINDKLYQSIDLEHSKFLKQYEFNGISNKEVRPYYFLETIYNAIFNQKSIIMSNRRNKSEIIPYTCVMNGGFYYLVYQYPGVEKLYTQRFDRIKKIEEGRSCNDTDLIMQFKEKDIKKYLKHNVGSYHSDTIYRIEVKIINDANKERILDVLSTDFNNFMIKDEQTVSFDAIDAPTTYANLIKLGCDIKITPKDDYKLIIDNYKKVLSDTLKLY